jgi:DNA-binding GntR family transcriptional regulator
MSETDAHEVCFARYTLEAVALKGLRPAARHLLADRMDKALDAMKECAANGDLAGLVEGDIGLHRVVVEASGHPLIVDLWSGLNGRMGALMRSSLDRQHIGLDHTVRRHAELIAAFRDGPAPAVATMLRDHYLRPEQPPTQENR